VIFFRTGWSSSSLLPSWAIARQTTTRLRGTAYAFYRECMHAAQNSEAATCPLWLH
jgi:hypothetical protein